MTGARVFISYRRDDAAGEAGRLADHLQKRFGADRVFLDIETIEPGTDFVQVLQRSLKETAAVLVVIGRQWVDIATPRARAGSTIPRTSCGRRSRPRSAAACRSCRCWCRARRCRAPRICRRRSRRW